MLRFCAPALTNPNTRGSETLTAAQLRILVGLEDDGPLPMSALAVLGGVTRATATGMVDRLVARRLVRRYSEESNRRTVLVEVLPEGQRTLEETRKRVDKRLNMLVRHLGPEQKGQLRGLLDMLANAIAQESRHGLAIQPATETGADSGV